MRSITIYSFILANIFGVYSQNSLPKNHYSKMLWLGYYNMLSLNDKWSVNSDFQFRTINWYKDPSQALIRAGLVYKTSDKINYTVGVAHFRYFLTDTKTRGEWRPWQEIAHSDNVGKVLVTQRLRAEERFNQKTEGSEAINDYTFNWRFRFKFDVQFPLFKKEGKTVWLIAGNEIMINAGQNIVYNRFDQNRSYVGINYEHNKNITYQIVGMHIWQQLPNGITMDNISVIRFNIIHKIKV